MSFLKNRYYLLAIVLGLILLAVHLIHFSSELLVEGETGGVSSVSIEYAVRNQLVYPLHGNWYPEVDNFNIHPPLHYFLMGLFLKLTGIGTTQIHGYNLIINLIFIAMIFYIARRFFDNATSIVVLWLSIGFYGWHYMETYARPESMLGLMVTFFSLLLMIALFESKSRKGQYVISALLGAFTLAAIESHYYGIFLVMYLPLFLLYLLYKTRDFRFAFMNGILMALGGFVVMIPWIALHGKQFPDAIRASLTNTVQRVDRLGFGAPTRIFEFLNENKGGWSIYAGIGLFGIVLAIYLVNTFRQYRQAGLPVKIPAKDLFVAFMLVSYLVFYWFVILNRNPPNLAIIFFPLLLVSARGYAQIYNWIIESKKIKPLFVNIASISFLFVYLAIALPRIVPEPGAPWRTYDGIRKTFLDFMLPEPDLLIDAIGFHYAYEFPYESPYGLEVQFRTEDSFWSDPYSVDYAVRREAFDPDINMMILYDTAYWHSQFYINPRFWLGDFLRVGMVYPDGVSRGHFPFTNQFSIFYSLDHVDRDSLEIESASGCNNEVMWISKNPDIMTDLPSTQSYNSLSIEQKNELFTSYLDSHNWFGNSDSSANLDVCLSQIDRYINYNSSANRVIIVEQAYDSVLASCGVIMCR